MGRYKKVSLKTEKKNKEKVDKKFKINILSVEDAAYIAGIFDGEGSISLTKTNICRKYGVIPYRLRIKITNTFPGIMDWIALKVGHGTVYKAKIYPTSNKQSWEWYIAGRRAIDLLKQLYPYLRIKKLQAEVAFQYSKTIAYPGTFKLDDKVLVFREELRAKMSSLNN